MPVRTAATALLVCLALLAQTSLGVCSSLACGAAFGSGCCGSADASNEADLVAEAEQAPAGPRLERGPCACCDIAAHACGAPVQAELANSSERGNPFESLARVPAARDASSIAATARTALRAQRWQARPPPSGAIPTQSVVLLL
ncbi:hypothetical protein [Haliangium ochraceum]|uniref:Uncharacterized protein n=1 Tax=Haliangium ochraceum (strain DSM 14365 / JCM 11303 / SMP-2) TaxID=502025 RepID=D0LX28_HALO1|nr:hypothetical protein [Haliangium ochraceum]ACY16070.1 hypothetical protein Hoch_3568 [Haliangium ochraceum DSM 14365]